MLTQTRQLLLHHEIMLLSLRDREGTIQNSMYLYAVAGAMMTELILQKRISVGPTKYQLVEVLDQESTGDEILDEVIEKVVTAKRRRGLGDWISNLATMPKLKQRVASQLCARKVLRNETESVLWFFSREIYPEINPKYERSIKHRMADLMFGQTTKHDERTTVLVALSHHAGLLQANFDKGRLKRNKERLKKIVAGDMYAARATRSAVEALESAINVAAVIPTACAG